MITESRSGRSNRAYFFLALLGLQLLFCGGSSSGSNSSPLLPLLGQESGDDGICTVTGLGSSIRSGFTRASQVESPVRFQNIRGTYYSVISVSGANPGTILEVSFNINPDLYFSNSCPLALDNADSAESGTDYILESGSRTKIRFLRRGNYMVYFQLQGSVDITTISLVLTGTPPTSTVSGVGSLSFVKSCENATANACTELFGTEAACSSGETEIAASGRCPTSNVLGVCRQPKGTTGYRFTIFFDAGGNTAIGATLLCTGLSGTFTTGYTAP